MEVVMAREEVKFSVGFPLRFYIQIGAAVFEVTVQEVTAVAELPDFLTQAKATQRALQKKLAEGNGG